MTERASHLGDCKNRRRWLAYHYFAGLREAGVEFGSHESFKKVGFSLSTYRNFGLVLLSIACVFSGEARSQIGTVLAPQTYSEVQGSHVQAITHITNIDPRSGVKERRDMTILFRDFTILTVEDSAAVNIPLGTEIHDERGRYVMPGLWDVHVHLLQVGPKAFPLFLANGITSVSR